MQALLIGVWMLVLTLPIAYAQTGSQGVAQPEVEAPGRYLVFFALDQATLTEADRRMISQAVDEYRRTGAARIVATGHTDTSGSATYNLELSLRRAEIVANELVRQGVPPTDITTVGQGEEDLLVPTADGVREPRNRRVQIVVWQPPPAPVAEAAPVEVEPAEEPGPFAFTIGPMYGHNFGETDDGGENDLAGAQLGISVLPGFLGGVSLKQGAFWSFNGDDDGLTGRSVAALELAPDLGIVRPILAANLEAAAPLVAEAGASAACATPADSVVARRPGGHRGVGASEVEGNLVRFVVPLGDLDVGEPDEMPLIPLWATSTLRGTVDRAPNPETGDDCAHPQARTETLVQPRIEIDNLFWISSFTTDGAIGPNASSAIANATSACQQDAQNAGLTNTDGIFPWLSNSAFEPRSVISNPDSVGPIQTADGSTVADALIDIYNCYLAPDNCLLAPIDKDINGTQVTVEFTWTGTFADGSDFPSEPFPNCNDWTSNSNDDIGVNGEVGALSLDFTVDGWVESTAAFPPCGTSNLALMCFQFGAAE
jgi:OmpA family